MKVTSFSDVDRALDELRGRISKADILKGHQLDGIDLTSTATKVPHKLGRRIRGYFVVNRSDITPVTIERLVPAAVFSPVVLANWQRPVFIGATSDYYQSTATPQSMSIPLPIVAGETVTRIGLSFYRAAANNPTNLNWYSAYDGATATLAATSTAWTNPSASTTWTELFATYDGFNGAVAPRGNHYLVLTSNNIGDRVRAAYVTLETEPQCVDVWADSEGKADLATNLHLRAATPMTVSLWVY
jgi:hypothetical protein